MASQELKECRDLRRQKPEIIPTFEPSPNFEEEFLEFVETVLFWNEDKESPNKDE